MRRLKLHVFALSLLLVSGCVSYGVVDNQPLSVTSATAGYSMGLRAIYEIVEISGGAKAFVEGKLGHKPPPRLAIISVNASTDPEPEMNASNKQPSLSETIDAMYAVQLHRYNIATLELMDDSMTSRPRKWGRYPRRRH